MKIRRHGAGQHGCCFSLLADGSSPQLGLGSWAWQSASLPKPGLLPSGGAWPVMRMRRGGLFLSDALGLLLAESYSLPQECSSSRLHIGQTRIKPMGSAAHYRPSKRNHSVG